MKRLRKNFTIILVFAMIFILVACGKDSKTKDTETDKKQTDKKRETDDSEDDEKKAKKKETNLKKDVFTLNEVLYRNSAPKDFTEDWQSMQFLYNSEKFDILGKALKDVPGVIEYKAQEDVKKIEVGTSIDVGLVVKGENPLSKYPINLRLVNDKSEDIAIEDGIIAEVGLKEGGVQKKHPDSSKTDYFEGYILPKGLTCYDKESRIKELYGNPTVEGKSLHGMSNYFLYQTRDKKDSMIITTFSNKVTITKLTRDISPEFIEQMKKSPELDDFSKDLNKDSYVNINGYKIKMKSKFKDIFQALSLKSHAYKKERAEEQLKKKIAAKKEEDFIARVPGFANYFITFRLYNPSNKTISVMDSTVIGVKVSREKDMSPERDKSMLPDPTKGIWDNEFKYDLKVVTPYGVKINEDIKEAFKKLPDKATEKKIINGKGGYFSNNVGNMHMKVIVVPVDGKELVNEILLTVLDVNK